MEKRLFAAELIMGKAFEQPRGEIKEVMFNVVPSPERPGILTPRINLEGSFFKDFATGGRPEQYKVSVVIIAERTDYVQKGIPAEVKAPEPVKAPDPQPPAEAQAEDTVFFAEVSDEGQNAPK